ncbi:MAG: prepilin-type N-terminal cleavage/methylation domain-containing protein [Oscillospiraceae bacterium]|jgi:prepilin-type N-terminal cleavage/methylation domain-containing protein|nr:prepilin-type N-terminal cleavage/methylation domain-containing protein [Oscillospiraceae bacterium]
MHPIRDRRGFSLVELLITLIILALVLTLVSLAVVGYIDKARGVAVAADARTVYITAQGVLAGAADAPERAELLEELNRLLAPGITLGDELGDGVAVAALAIEDGVITSLTYSALLDGRAYQALLVPGAETVVTRVDDGTVIQPVGDAAPGAVT